MSTPEVQLLILLCNAFILGRVSRGDDNVIIKHSLSLLMLLLMMLSIIVGVVNR